MNIRNSIALTDRMTPVLRSILKAMDSTLRVMQMVDKQASSGVTSKAYRQAERDIQRANNALIKMGNYADMANSRVQSSTAKSVREMNALEAAALGAKKAFDSLKTTKIGSGIGSATSKVKSFSLSGAFSNMQTKGTNMMIMSSMLGGSKLKGIAGDALRSIGSLGSGALKVFGMIGRGTSTAFSIAKNSITQFGQMANNVMNSVANRGKMAWDTIAGGVYVVKNVAAALSNLTALSDNVTSDIARLSLFNYSDKTNGQMYGMVYQAAEASRSYISATSELANRIAISGVYGEQEGSLENAINMAETINKALVLGGGTSEENSRAILQLSQGLSSGVLQGDDLRSIRQQSPYLAKMLAEGLAKVDDSFIGTTIGDLRQLGAEGKLTSDVVIKAFEAMEEQIDATFDEKAPKTWAQGVTSITNTVKFFMGILQQMEGGPLQKITGLVWQIAEYLKSQEGMKLLAGIATVLGVIGDVLSFVITQALNLVSWLIDNAYILMSVFLVLGTVAMISGLQALFAWLSATWPLLLVIAIVAVIIKILLDLGFTFGDIVGAICGGIMVIIAFFKHLGLAVWGIMKGIWAVLEGLWTNAGLAFENVGLGIKSFFSGILSDVLGFIADIAAALSKLPFLNFDASGIVNTATRFADQQAQADADIEANKAAMTDLSAAFTEAYNSVGAFEDGWASDAYDAGYQWGNRIVEGIGDNMTNIAGMFDTSSMDYSAAIPSTVVDGGNLDSVGSIGSDVNISDEDIKLLRDMTARDYLLQLQTITPVANVTFGDVRETADVGKIVEVIEQMVDEQMATALVS